MNGPANLPRAGEGWTASRVALLRRHFDVGLTAAESALLLGGVSKNAVISKRTRLGLVGVARPSAQPQGLGKSAASEARLRLRPEPQFRRLPLPDMNQPPPSDASPKTLARHRTGECLWPLGGAEEAGDWRTLFCCAPAAPGRRYCQTHISRARL